MTRWGLILLIAFMVIGLRSSIETPRAVRWVVGVAAVVLVFTFVKGHAL
jgi:VIT1/CCC1 family predicted Fe2+/Mn2+ transporter